jgi:hypothetical protein
MEASSEPRDSLDERAAHRFATSYGVFVVEDPCRRARILIEDQTITLTALWARYWANGGSAKEHELDAYINGALEPDGSELWLLHQALEEITDP